MPRPKKEKPNRKDGLYEIKMTVGRKLDGRPIRKSFYSAISIADARNRGMQYKIDHKVAEQVGFQSIDEGITFGEWAGRWLITYKKPNVDINTYLLSYKDIVEKHLNPYFAHAQINAILPVNIQEFYATKVSFSVSMLKKMKMCLNGIFESAIENQLCLVNPARNIKFSSDALHDEKQVYSDEQMSTVRTYALAHDMPEVALLLDTGLRRGELLGLMWTDISEKEGTLTISRSIADRSGGGCAINPPKWDSYRTIPLPQRALSLLHQIPRDGLYIFAGATGQMQSPNSWSQRLKRFMARLREEHPEIPSLTAHELRHTYGTWLRRHEVDIYTIAKLMGHRDVNITANVYVHAELEQLRNALPIK